MNDTRSRSLKGLSIGSLIVPILVLAVFCFTGCAHYQTATTQNLPVASASGPGPGKALIIVEGTDSWCGIFKLYACNVFDNDTLVGRAGPHGKLMWERDPGPLRLGLWETSKGWGKDYTVAAGETVRYRLQFDANQGYSADGPGISHTGAPWCPGGGYPVYDPGQTIQGQYNQQQIQGTINSAAQFRNSYDNSMRR